MENNLPQKHICPVGEASLGESSRRIFRSPEADESFENGYSLGHQSSGVIKEEEKKQKRESVTAKPNPSFSH